MTVTRSTKVDTDVSIWICATNHPHGDRAHGERDGPGSLQRSWRRGYRFGPGKYDLVCGRRTVVRNGAREPQHVHRDWVPSPEGSLGRVHQAVPERHLQDP